MVKCPRGTSSQIKANYRYFNEPPKFSLSGKLFSWIYDPIKGEMVHVGKSESQILIPESEDSELDSARADKRCPPSARDELVYFFISYFLDILVDRWESKPCKKPKFRPEPFALNENENFGEDLGPCEEFGVFSTADFLKDLYKKRSSNFSKENLKKDSESVDSEYLNEVDSEVLEFPDLFSAFVPDEEVHFSFVNGVWYRGRVSRKLMEGDGTYFWEDGSSYQGDFVAGCATGKGRLEFSNMTVYEGDVYRAFRHGEGLCCFLDSPVMYSGQWWLGKKHGHGLIVYNDPSEGENFFRGQWQDGYKEGFGFRQYSSGSKYIGFWSKGKRHGKGVMLWSNNDIYKGQWKEGLMHGYGEYTWNGFVNKTLSYPAINTYRGFWSEGNRDGHGVLECKNGAWIETVWVENKKNGPGIVVCCNGAVVASERLFEKDKQAPFSDQEDKLGLLVGDSARLKRPVGKAGDGAEAAEEREHLMAYLTSVERAKAISIPILSPPQMLNLDLHTQKYWMQKKMHVKRNESLPNSDPENKGGDSKTDVHFWNSPSFDPQNAEQLRGEVSNQGKLIECIAQEDKQLRNYITVKIFSLKACYDHYATLACDKPPSFQCVLLRMFLWQMLNDAGIPTSELSLVDIDLMAAQEESLLVVSPHDPFERIYFWQFLHILILLSWHLYGQYVLGCEPLIETERISKFLEFFKGAETNMVLKTAFEYLLENNIFQGRFGPNHDSFSNRQTGFEESDFAPMEAMYQIYCNVGVPHSARDFLNAVCRKTDKDEVIPNIVRYFERLPCYKMDGKNALTVGGELHHLPGPEPFNHPQLFALEPSRSSTNPAMELACFKGLKATGVLKCLTEICPAIVSDGSVVNMDYKLTFHEFYKVIILCTERQLKLKVMKEIRNDLVKNYKAEVEEYEKKRLEHEKHRDSTISRKKSRQLSDPSKRARRNIND